MLFGQGTLPSQRLAPPRGVSVGDGKFFGATCDKPASHPSPSRFMLKKPGYDLAVRVPDCICVEFSFPLRVRDSGVQLYIEGSL